jgi:hypothetical protein
MVATGLLDIPPEIQLQVAELAKTRQNLKALSLTCSSLRSIAQSLLFARLRLNTGEGIRGPVIDLLANPQICSSIRVLRLTSRYPSTPILPRSDEENLSIIKKFLPEMVGLKAVKVYRVKLSREFMDGLLETAAIIPLRVKLDSNIYPSGRCPKLNTPTRISHLHLGDDVPYHPSTKFYRFLLRASAITLKELYLTVDGDRLERLADIDLPFLDYLTLFIREGNEASLSSATAFLAVQRTIRKLVFKGRLAPLRELPSDALPNLRELSGSSELINQLVPGRPVEVIEITFRPGVGLDWLGEEVARSTARIRRLEVHQITATLEERPLKHVVAILPSLESLWLSVSNFVSGSFVPVP